MPDVLSLWQTPARVALISPAGAVDPARYDLTLRRLADAGITVCPGPEALARCRYLAGTARARVDDLYQAFERDDIDAVWCLRGGYGAAHLLPLIDWSRLTQGAKRPLIGYSDVTVLLDAFYQHGLEAIHAAVATEVALVPAWPPAREDDRWRSLQSIESAWHASSGRMASTPFSGPALTVSGQLRGGNLVTLASLCGTPNALALKQPTLLMLEEVEEVDFRIERCFHQLLSSIDTRWLSGVCLGSFTRQGEPTYSSHDTLAEWLGPLNIPLHHRLPFGHHPLNQAWPYGALGTLSASGGLCWHKTVKSV